MEEVPFKTEYDPAARKSRKKRAGHLGVESIKAIEEKASMSAERSVAYRQPAPEAHQLHGSKRSQEHIGHMLLAAESSGEKSDKAASRRQIETMPRAELLSLSEKIMINGSSLRQIYESHLIGEHGLRRLIIEYRRGGDLEKALRVEVIERELDFERDPAMRGLSRQASTPIMGDGRLALDTLLKHAAASLPEVQEEAAYFKARAEYEAVESTRRHRQRRLIDIVLTTSIIVLISAVILLYLRGN